MAEEENEVVDPLQGLRDECAEHHCLKFKEELEKCNERVNSKTKTSETCHQEMVDFIHCVDHCALPKLFKKLK